MPISSPRRTLARTSMTSAHQAMLKCPWQWRKPFLDARRASRKRQMGDGLFYDPVDPTFIDHLLPFYSKKFGLGLEHDEKTQIEHEMRRLMRQRQQQEADMESVAQEDEEQQHQHQHQYQHGSGGNEQVHNALSTYHHLLSRSPPHQQQQQLVAEAVTVAAKATSKCISKSVLLTEASSIPTRSTCDENQTQNVLDDWNESGSRHKRLCVEASRQKVEIVAAIDFEDVDMRNALCELVSDDLANCYFTCDLDLLE